MLLKINLEPFRKAYRESLPGSALYQVGNVIPPWHVACANKVRAKEKHPLRAMRFQNWKSEFIVIAVSVVEREQDTASAASVFVCSVDKCKRLFKSNYCVPALDICNLFVKFICSCGKNRRIPRVPF